MSLVIAYNAKECLILCSDGRAVTPQDGHLLLADDRVKKIKPVLNDRALCGWVGERYDAEAIISTIQFIIPSPLETFLKNIAFHCQHINALSFDYSIRNNQEFCPTGLIIGGYYTGSRFLATITPYGQVLTHSQYAVIGIGADIASEHLERAQKHPLSAKGACEVISDIVNLVSRESEYVGGQLSCYLAFPGNIVEVPVVDRSKLIICDNLSFKEVGLPHGPV
jgi:20S proteasome alpha/beta subunit